MLGVLVGLLLTPIGLVLSTVGMARLAAVNMPTELVTTDLTGVSMLAAGALALVVTVLLGLWSASVPLTGGVIWGLGLGLLYLIAPVIVEAWVDAAYTTRPEALIQLLSRLADGTWATFGLLLTTAGLLAGLARRRGRVFGEHTALATQARIEASRAEESRRQAAEAEEAERAARARSIS